MLDFYPVGQSQDTQDSLCLIELQIEDTTADGQSSVTHSKIDAVSK